MNARICFGYGSLVNRNTQPFVNLGHAEIIGWQRSWTHQIDTPSGGVSSLTIVPAKGISIQGLVFKVEPHQIPSLNERETGYNVEKISESQISSQSPIQDVHTYISAKNLNGDASHPILQSYLDTVLLGFFTEFGQVGVQRFLETTVGWETPILTDRKTPRYPRTTPIETEIAQSFDDALNEIGANWVD